MKMRQFGVFLLLIVISNVDMGSTSVGAVMRVMKSIPSPDDIGAMIKFTRKIYEIFKDGKNNGDILTAFTDAAALLITGNGESSTRRIERKLTDISTQFTEMIMKMDSEFEETKKLIKGVPLLDQLNLMRHHIAEEIRRINDTLGDTFKSLRGEMGRLGEVMLVQKIMGSGEGNVQEALRKIHHHFNPETSMNVKTSFLHLMRQYVEDKKQELCGDGKSPNQYLYSLYEILITTEIMGFMSLSYGYRMYYQQNGNVDIRQDLFNVKKETEKRLESYFEGFKRAINSAPRDFRSCDPISHSRNETYIEMERLYQSVVIAESSCKKGLCQGTCDSIDVANELIKDILVADCPNHKDILNGIICQRLYDCRAIINPDVCPLPREDLRRYQWVRQRDGHIFGNTGECEELIIPFRDSFSLELFKCETCICTCEANSIVTMMSAELRGVHVISLEAARSSINNNMVITGVRFLKQNGIVHIQIKEGRLQSRGKIRQGSESWTDVHDTYTRVALSRDEGWRTEYENEEKFVVIDEFHNAINLDDIVVPLGHVMTGIKFGISKKEEAASARWKRIEIQVQYTAFNFTTGELLNQYKKSEWMSSETLHTEELIVNKNRDTPLNSKKRNLPNGDSNKFVKFVVSSFEKDLGQTTLPLLDAQPVESKPGSALAGVGLFHKGSPDFGGFLSFRLYSLNYADYMKSNEIRKEQEMKPAPVLSSYVYYNSRTNKYSESKALIFVCIFVITNYYYSM